MLSFYRFFFFNLIFYFWGYLLEDEAAYEITVPLIAPYVMLPCHIFSSFYQSRIRKFSGPFDHNLSSTLLLNPAGGLPCELEGIIESPLVNGYRNKCEFSAGYSLQGKPTVGFMLGNFRYFSYAQFLKYLLASEVYTKESLQGGCDSS